MKVSYIDRIIERVGSIIKLSLTIRIKIKGKNFDREYSIRLDTSDPNWPDILTADLTAVTIAFNDDLTKKEEEQDVNDVLDDLEKDLK